VALTSFSISSLLIAVAVSVALIAMGTQMRRLVG
jgi:hypothetical protein